MRLHTLLQGALPISLFGSLVFSYPAASNSSSYGNSTSYGCEATPPPPGSGPSCNTPDNRACWKKGFDINTDYEAEYPRTGVTRKYQFIVTEHYNFIGADGVTRAKAMLINGGFPGPTVFADWGDVVEVEVINKLQTNGTGINWHGVRQLNNNIHDGVPGVTEFPIPPGGSKTNTNHETHFGTSWYLTHFSAQYGYGVTGSCF